MCGIYPILSRKICVPVGVGMGRDVSGSSEIFSHPEDGTGRDLNTHLWGGGGGGTRGTVTEEGDGGGRGGDGSSRL